MYYICIVRSGIGVHRSSWQSTALHFAVKLELGWNEPSIRFEYNPRDDGMLFTFFVRYRKQNGDFFAAMNIFCIFVPRYKYLKHIVRWLH